MKLGFAAEWRSRGDTHCDHDNGDLSGISDLSFAAPECPSEEVGNGASLQICEDGESSPGFAPTYLSALDWNWECH